MCGFLVAVRYLSGLYNITFNPYILCIAESFFFIKVMKIIIVLAEIWVYCLFWIFQFIITVHVFSIIKIYFAYFFQLCLQIFQGLIFLINNLCHIWLLYKLNIYCYNKRQNVLTHILLFSSIL